MGEETSQSDRRSMMILNESQEPPVPSPSPAQSLNPLAGVEMGQASGITVLTLLDKLVQMLDTVQENQRKMEQRQVDMEGVVRGIQSDVTKLSKSHSSTSNSVNKLLEKSRKVSAHVRELQEKMDRQGMQVKKLEANHLHLLKRDKFKVLIFQDENEIPTSVLVKDPLPSPQEAEETPLVEANCSQEEGLHSINLSSDDEIDPVLKDEQACDEEELVSEHSEWSRTEKFKRSSLKKVDTLKRAFSRHNIEKNLNKIGTKIVPPEKREKIKKSFSTNSPKSPTSKSSSFKVTPLTFNVKKVRDGEPSPTSPKEDVPSPQIHTPKTHLVEESNAAIQSVEAVVPVSPSASSVEAEVSITEDGVSEPVLSSTLQQAEQEEQEQGQGNEEDDSKQGEEEEESPQNKENIEPVQHNENDVENHSSGKVIE